MKASLDSNIVANCVLKKFQSLAPKVKPRILPNGRREWVPLAGIVLSRDDEPTSLACVALATGMKCLPCSKIISAHGNILHDWHAETLAIRSFNRFLLDECSDLALAGRNGLSDWIEWKRSSPLSTNNQTDQVEETASGPARNPSIHSSKTWQSQPFSLKQNVNIYMYCSEAPCGDASMELVMAQQDDATPWARTAQSTIHNAELHPSLTLLGRGNFDQLGIVRRKPSRPDAPATLSKSCSDKLAFKQCTSLLLGLTSLLIHPKHVYLEALVLPNSQYVKCAVDRCFGHGQGGRFNELVNGKGAETTLRRWEEQGGYSFVPFEVCTTELDFEFSRRGHTDREDSKTQSSSTIIPSNLSALWTPKRLEVLINGVLQGRKQSDPQGASCVSRRRIWQDVLELSEKGREDEWYGKEVASTLKACNSYDSVKSSALLAGREAVKDSVRNLVLKGWVRNTGDGDWHLKTISN